MGLCLTILAVRDVSSSVAFYTAAFGWQQHVSAPNYAEFTLEDGHRVGLYERVGFGRNTGQVPHAVPAGQLTGTELYFHVDNVAAASQRLVDAGARLLSATALRDWGDVAAYHADPDGNVLVVARPA